MSPSSPLRVPLSPTEKSIGSQSPPTPDTRRRVNLDNRIAANELKDRLNLRKKSNRSQTSVDLGNLPDVGTLNIESPSTTPTSIARRRQEMSNKAVTFSGKPRQLKPCLTYCHVTLLANGVTNEAQKAGTLASLLRGPALDWLTRKVSENEAILEDYGELREQLKRDFALDETAERLQAARQLAGLQQKGSVHDYARRFEQLAQDAGLNDETKVALFTKGLKPRVREALIISDQSSTIDETVAEASRIDSQLYYAGRHNKPSYDGKQRRGKDGKFKSGKIKEEY